MLNTPLPDPDLIDTKVVDFEDSSRKVNNVTVELFFTGPESSASSFQRAMIKKFNEAVDSIIIDHMYFHPDSEAMEALIKAAKRGVQITVITAGVTDHCTSGESLFGRKNALSAFELVTNLNAEERKNVKVYVYNQIRKGLHKKVVLVDDSILAGSSNMGYKSLETMSDHEMNFKATSAELVEKTMEVIQQDIANSMLIKNPEIISWTTWGVSKFYGAGAFLWG
jgi:phosphatidylserine/phosphatidylglycerophosphate/cardiolipin synthase-like enzyme